MKLYALFAGAVMSVVSASAAQAQTAESGLLLGLGGTTLIAPALGLAPSLGIAFNVEGVLIMGEGFLGFDSGHMDLFYGGAAGTIFGGGRRSPYVLAGGGLLARGDDESSREAVALTLEAGMVLARTSGGSQIWLGARGFIPVSTLHARDYRGNPPEVPYISLNLRFWLGVL